MIIFYLSYSFALFVSCINIAYLNTSFYDILPLVEINLYFILLFKDLKLVANRRLIGLGLLYICLGGGGVMKKIINVLIRLFNCSQPLQFHTIIYLKV